MKRIEECMLRLLVALFAILPLTALAQPIHDIAVSISESADPVFAGSGAGNLVYTVTATNNGAAGATGLSVSVTPSLPAAGVTLDSVTPSAGTWSAPVWTIGNLGGGASVTLTFVLTVSNAAGFGSVGIGTHIASVEGTDPDDTNNTDTEATTIVTIVTINVSKDFSDDSTATVFAEVSCSFGGAPGPLSEGAPLVFNGSSFPAGATCQATETVPAGYEVSYSADCDINPVLSSSTYNCLITNTQLPVQLVVNKTFEDGYAGDVTVSVECADGTVTADDPTASGSDPAEFTISDFPAGGTTCTATETVPAGYTQLSSTCTDVAVTVASTPSCGFVNAPLRATFEVTKDFADGNPDEVEVTISCFTGLPLQQSQDISESQSVEFVVTDFDAGELDCEITEDVPDGYSPDYVISGNLGEGIAGDISGGPERCEFTDIVTGHFRCHIINNADPVDVVIEKLWVIEGAVGDELDTSYKLTLYCDTTIEGGQQLCEDGGTDIASSTYGNYLTCKTFYGDGSEVFTPKVYPQYPGSHCWVEETVEDSWVEIDNGCGNINISAGNGASCLITNTVFFEGIPTLSQYGMALLALLMLGVGVVGFRRFA